MYILDHKFWIKQANTYEDLWLLSTSTYEVIVDLVEVTTREDDRVAAVPDPIFGPQGHKCKTENGTCLKFSLE